MCSLRLVLFAVILCGCGGPTEEPDARPTCDGRPTCSEIDAAPPVDAGTFDAPMTADAADDAAPDAP